MSESEKQTPSQSLVGTSFSPTGASRPFLGLLNPIGRHYHGYTPAGLLQEVDDQEDVGDEDGTPRGSAYVSRENQLPLSNLPTGATRRAVLTAESDDDEVPQSFLIEANPTPAAHAARTEHQAQTKPSPRKRPPSRGRRPAPVLPLHYEPSQILEEESEPSFSSARKPFAAGLNDRERALWNWVNVYNLDAYLQDVYAYYEGKGIYCIALARGLNLLTIGFVIFFSTFLLSCVDYSLIRHESTTRLSDIVVGQCISRMSGTSYLFFIFFFAFWLWQIFTFILSILRLLDMYRFYTHLLEIPDVDVQTISWPEIVRRIAAIRDANPVTAISSNQQVHPDSIPTAKLDAHDIANRIMRQENYLIALFNKELLDLRVPIPTFLQPYLGNRLGDELKKGQVLTQALEWNLRFCLMSFLFDEGGRVRKSILKEKNRQLLVESLQRRLIFMGCLNALLAPFIVPYLLVYSFFRYFEEYHKNPSSVSGRSYTRFAQWKFREFNELPHLFTRRLNESYPYATEYINQFPNERIALIMRFITFIVGSFAAVLLLASVLDPDVFTNFEITPHRSVIYYLTICVSVLAALRGMVPDKRQVFDPEYLMKEVIMFTHYMPSEWKGRLHSQSVHKEFGQFYAMKVMIFIQELLSVILTPFILWYTLPKCTPEIIDFFRDFTVHVEGLGYVCSFAVFNFERHGNVNFGAPHRIRDERLLSKQGKMEKSILNFKAAHPDWNPSDPAGSLYLTKMADLSANYQPRDQSPQQAFLRKSKVLQDRASRYDQAMQKSMATRRRLGSSQSRHPNLQQSEIPEEERAPDGGVQSQLGDSYVEDVQTRGGMLIDRGKPFAEQSQVEQEDELVNGGFVGLLAQIYDQRRQVI